MALSDEIAAALRLAARSLAQRARTEAQVRRKLLAAGFDPAAVQGAIERMRELRWLDDAELARTRASQLLHAGRLGPLVITQRLGAQGISQEAVDDAVRQARGEATDRDLVLQALSRRRPPVGPDSPPKERARAARSLVSRGFCQETVASILGPLDAGEGG